MATVAGMGMGTPVGRVATVGMAGMFGRLKQWVTAILAAANMPVKEIGASLPNRYRSNKYERHQGQQECSRRVAQMAAGKLSFPRCLA